jgi:hypothetical protein
MALPRHHGQRPSTTPRWRLIRIPDSRKPANGTEALPLAGSSGFPPVGSENGCWP